MADRPKRALSDACPAAELFRYAHHFAAELRGQQLAEADPGGGVEHAVVEVVDDSAQKVEERKANVRRKEEDRRTKGFRTDIYKKTKGNLEGGG